MSSFPIVSTTVRRAATRRVVGAFVILGIGLVAVLPISTATAAQAPVGLGTAGSFAVLAGEGITNTGPTAITGDVGTHPNPAMTGFGPGGATVAGATHAADSVALQAKNDLTTAYNTAAGATPTASVATELGGLTFTPGVYSGAELAINGTMTLNTLGDPNAVFIFQGTSTLITGVDSSVVVLGGGTACNVFWQIASSATLGTRTSFIGTVLAATSIQANSGATVQGRLLAGTASVTLNSNTITRPVCATAATTTTSSTSTTSTTVRSAPSTTLPGGGLTAPASGAAVPGGSAPAAPGVPTGGSAPSGPTGGTAGPGAPGLPATGVDLGLGVAGLGAVLFGVALLAAAKLRLRSAPNA